MCLTPDRAKQAILHPEQHARDEAIYYFSRSFSQDKDIVPLTIKAIELYGEEAFQSYTFLESLTHTDATAQWMIGQLASLKKPSADECGTLWAGIALALRHVDLAILKNYESQIEGLDCLDPEWHESVQERIQLPSMGPVRLWADLDDFCERHKNDERVSDEELDYAHRLVEALGRHPGEIAEQVMAVLTTEIEDYRGNPLTWMEPYAVRLAGYTRLEQAVPQIVGKLLEDEEWLNSECMWALTRIGTDSVVEALAEDFLDADWGYRLCSTEILENIHSDLSVEKCFELLEDEDDDLIRRELYKALLINGATAAIEPARELLLEEEEKNPDWIELRSDLVTSATIMEVDFPELSDWKDDMRNDVEFRKKWYAEHVAPGLDVFDEESDDDYFDDEESDWPTVPPATVVTPERVGRNDPCPCGSGKKYKKCCIRKENGSALK